MVQRPAGAASWRIDFLMPAGLLWTMLPVPDNPAVNLVTVPPETDAVIWFSGIAMPGAVAHQRQTLLAALDRSV